MVDLPVGSRKYYITLFKGITDGLPISSISYFLPAGVTLLNGVLGKAIDSFSRAADELTLGIRSKNLGMIRDAEAYITQGDEYAKQAAVIMQGM